MSKDLSDNMLELNEAVKGYIQTRLDLIKVTILEKIAKFSLYLITFLIIVLFIFLILACVTTAFIIWYDQTYNNMLVGLLIALGFLISICILFIVFGKKLIIKNVLQNVSEILLEEDEE
jgi:hypothetical protein